MLEDGPTGHIAVDAEQASSDDETELLVVEDETETKNGVESANE